MADNCPTPPGWTCTRPPHTHGPCAAIPAGEVDLEAIEARANAATAAPWAAKDHYPYLVVQPVDDDYFVVSVNLAGRPQEDATFIAAARTDVPLLVDLVRRLRAQVAEYENTITWNTTCHGCAHLLDALYATEPLKDLARWLVSLHDIDTPDRRTVTLRDIIDRAREALRVTEEASRG